MEKKVHASNEESVTLIQIGRRTPTSIAIEHK